MTDLDENLLTPAMRQLLSDREEKLHPDLEAHIWTSEGGLQFVKHPLVNDLVTLPGALNRLYLSKKRHLDSAIKNRDWETAVQITERPWRAEALVDYIVGRDGHTGDPLPLSACSRRVQNFAAWVWSDSENIEQVLHLWEAMFDGGEQFCIGDFWEWKNLPATLDVWRAKIGDGDWSWSLDKSIAAFFARRFGSHHDVQRGTVHRDYLFGYISRRGESECLVLEDRVDITQTIKEEEWSQWLRK